MKSRAAKIVLGQGKGKVAEQPIPSRQAFPDTVECADLGEKNPCDSAEDAERCAEPHLRYVTCFPSARHELVSGTSFRQGQAYRRAR